MPRDTKNAINKLISGSFLPKTESQKSDLVDDAFNKLGRDAKASAATTESKEETE